MHTALAGSAERVDSRPNKQIERRRRRRVAAAACKKGNAMSIIRRCCRFSLSCWGCCCCYLFHMLVRLLGLFHFAVYLRQVVSLFLASQARFSSPALPLSSCFLWCVPVYLIFFYWNFYILLLYLVSAAALSLCRFVRVLVSFFFFGMFFNCNLLCYCARMRVGVRVCVCLRAYTYCLPVSTS